MPSRSSPPPQARPASEPYGRLVSRFFESLMTLVALGEFRGDRVSKSEDEDNPETVRRQFEKNLAFLCDRQKGGSATSAGALENSETCYKFWIASNDDQSGKTVPFLKGVTESLYKISLMTAGSRAAAEQEMTRKTIHFARCRIKDERKLVLNNARVCIERLDAKGDSSLVQWLTAFIDLSSQSPDEFCQYAYDSRRDSQMKDLAELGRDPKYQRPEDADQGSPFEKVKHYIGRAAHHIRAVKQLVEASSAMSTILQSCEVWPVPRMPPVAKPKAVKRTSNPNLICNRLDFEPGSEEREAFIEMDRKHDLTATIVELYKQDRFCNNMHAEIQVLEHFSRNHLRFVDNDRFVACSKTACYCCHLYFLKHPLRPVEPETHKKIYPNWAPPALRGGLTVADAEFRKHRDILIGMIKEIKAGAKEQIQQGRGPHPFHQDSTTGITKTVHENEAHQLTILGMEALRLDSDTEDDRQSSESGVLV